MIKARPKHVFSRILLSSTLALAGTLLPAELVDAKTESVAVFNQQKDIPNKQYEVIKAFIDEVTDDIKSTGNDDDIALANQIHNYFLEGKYTGALSIYAMIGRAEANKQDLSALTIGAVTAAVLKEDLGLDLEKLNGKFVVTKEENYVAIAPKVPTTQPVPVTVITPKPDSPAVAVATPSPQP